MSQNGNGKERKVKNLLAEYGKMTADIKALRESSGVAVLEESLDRIKSEVAELDRKSTRLNSSHRSLSRMPSSA